MNLHAVIEHSKVNGPGDRSVVWVKGCQLACPGCWNQDTHSFTGGLQVYDADLANQLVDIAGTQGVTLSGGEPMHQAFDLGGLLFHLWRRTKFDGFSVGMYTGYTLRELELGDYFTAGLPSSDTLRQKWWQMIKRDLDFAVMGRYNQHQADDSRPLCSSRNQELVLFSNRYTYADFASQEFEMQIDGDGLVQVTGFPPEGI